MKAQKPLIELSPISENPNDYDELEKYIMQIFRREIYLPLLKEVGEKKPVLNSLDDLMKRVQRGDIRFYRGKFSGKFDAKSSRELKKLGAVYEKTTKSFRLPKSELPFELQIAISASQARIQQVFQKIDKKLSSLIPEKIAENFKLEKFFDTALWKTEKKVNKTLKNITVPPQLTPERRAKIAAEYTKNMQLYIQNFTEEEIVKLRKKMIKHTFSGMRHESIVDTIEKSYGVSQRKAKFLARQETSLLMVKFKESRYTDAGVSYYRWQCVVGSPNHPVRPMHKKLEGKVFRWDDPPITDKYGNRNNPGEDYNCRCTARPIVKF